MAGKVFGQSAFGFFGKRAFAAQTATKPKPQTESITLPKQDVKTTSLPNGTVVSSIENYSPIARIAVAVKAGPRYEDSDNLGISHCVRNCAGLSTKNLTIFGITRHIEYMGGNLGVTSDRENIMFQLECNRDHMDKYIKYLGEVVAQPAFKHWEVSDFAPRMQLDAAQYHAHPENVLMDALHRAAYRGGLAHSLCSPDFMIGRHKSDMLRNYWKDTFTAGRATFVGVGVDHQHLLDHVKQHFPLEGGQGNSAGASKYKGGEVFVDLDLPVVYVAVAAEGASLKNQKELLSLGLLQQILGVGPRAKYSEATASKLGSAASKATKNPFAVTSMNVNYSDTGLFGFCVAGQPEEMTNIVKAVVGQMKESSKSPSAQELTAAKTRLKAALLYNTESSQQLLEELASQDSLANPAAIEKAVDSITAQDVAAVAGKLMKGKGALAAVGKVHHCPYLEDLV